MIRCNLSILLAERNLKITKVSKDTGVSRTTLTSLSNNYSQGIQFDTINTLCNYLKVTPEQLITYIPIDISVEKIDLYGESMTINLIIIENNRAYKCSMPGDCYLTIEDDKLDCIDLFIDLYEPTDEEVIKENKLIVNAINLLSTPFLNDLENTFFEKVLLNFNDKDISPSLSANIKWSDKFNL
ncbi:helix-turn-helix transcriptional regulator [Clostridium perfringens]|uniref:helix-turn-helix domain-containing protein n=1 Tax=Clostridium perfringens TaxID=1502 RepID=UPI0013E28C64|nr:helix-turn-helix transcriptional regulator [Clostridium perfringens]NGT53113.1 helix-turn-helix transcriptional regulator [Clostridium perfringens]NGT74133.1 helix-turn-helix transcriptional regulator [Clostridium perfringens]NGU22793.1 helix-turn-helix transcriptional regulator [Clostridium perfringens]